MVIYEKNVFRLYSQVSENNQHISQIDNDGIHLQTRRLQPGNNTNNHCFTLLKFIAHLYNQLNQLVLEHSH